MRILSRESVGSARTVRLVLIPLALALGLALTATAQLPDCPPNQTGFPSQLPPTPEPKPRPAEGPQSIKSFVDSVSSNDAAFEVIVGQGRILTTKADIAMKGKQAAFVALGDPFVADFRVISSRQIRILGQRVGVTDLSIVTSDNQVYNFEVRVVADLDVLRGQLQLLFPDARLKLAQIRDHVVVEGEARDTRQVAQIMDVTRNYLLSVSQSQVRKSQAALVPALPVQPQVGPPAPPGAEVPIVPIGPEQGGVKQLQGVVTEPKVINLIRVPGPQQVLLKVRVAELNRTAMRQIGADLAVVTSNGSVGGTQIGAGSVSATGIIPGTGGLVTSPIPSGASSTFFSTAPTTTAFGIFEKNFEVLLAALRRNEIVKILAEPNLVAMHGHQASFLAGGEFPVPVPQTSTGGAGTSVTVLFKPFGVRLNFVPYILDGDTIRLSVAPEVSSIDFSIGTIIVPGGSPVPGLNVRNANTTVELHEGQTLAIAGLLQVTLDNKTDRIPGLGDLPILGPFFQNTTGQRMERELIVLVTPYLVESLDPHQVPAVPGDDVHEPDDWEFYFHHRIESFKAGDWRSTVRHDDAAPEALQRYFRLERDHVRGPTGFCD